MQLFFDDLINQISLVAGAGVMIVVTMADDLGQFQKPDTMNSYAWPMWVPSLDYRHLSLAIGASWLPNGNF
jgi:hypothetical protein